MKNACLDSKLRVFIEGQCFSRPPQRTMIFVIIDPFRFGGDGGPLKMGEEEKQ